MQVAYEPWFVLLSIAMPILGGYVGFDLAAQIRGALGTRRRFLLASAAVALAAAVWSMQFVAMLAARFSFPVDYLVLPTLLSFLVCIIVIGVAVFAVSGDEPSLARLLLSACLMGAGIFATHYVGMAALAASAYLTNAPSYVAASLAIAIALSGLALWLTMDRRLPLILPALLFGIAVSCTHYMAMAGTNLSARALASSAPALSPDVLTIVVAIVAFCIFAAVLLLLVPDRAKTAPQILTAAAVAPGLAEDGSQNVTVAAAATGSDSDLRRGIFAPLGGVGAPPPRIAEQLPIERDGATHFVPVENVVAVHANAHYTFLFDGSAKLFCPLAIGEVESRLDRGRFMRVHRSHIVNIDRVVGTKKSGDGEVLELAADCPYTVPVSRSRAGWLKSRIKEKSGGLRQGG